MPCMEFSPHDSNLQQNCSSNTTLLVCHVRMWKERLNRTGYRWFRNVRSTIVFLCCAGLLAQSGDWPTYGHDPGGQRFSPLTTINTSNVQSLKIAWTYRTGDAYAPPSGSRPTQFEATPLYVDGTLYLSTPLGRVIAL